MITTTLGDTHFLIHHPNEVEVFALTKEQIVLLYKDDASEWKGKASSAISIFMTCIINLLAFGWQADNVSFRLNAGIGVISFVCWVFLYIFTQLKKNNAIKE